jgi:general secretion pathway protein F/type IV pilus assembly protein PilC
LSKLIDNATAALQPVIILAMASMVGTMAWMMMNVIYGTLDQIQKR